MNRVMTRRARWGALLLALFATASLGFQCSIGLDPQALQELSDAGVDQYLGSFTPAATEDVGDGWTKHSFDPDGGNGPICIAGTPYSVFTRAGDPDKLLIFEQGGGACWQDFYFCNILADAQAPPFPRDGIWDFDSPNNPFRDYSIVYMPYCDGSVFSGDADVPDVNFPFGPVRFHRGLRNQSAGMDVAKATFPSPKKVTLAGSSAGGVGVAGFAPFLARFEYGNYVDLTVFNDAGPVATNVAEVAAAEARRDDWQFDRFYPASCTDCDALGQATAIIDWRLSRDGTIREAIYDTDGDATNRFFLNIATQAEYRALIVSEHGALHEKYPFRYRRFFKSGDDTHTALQDSLFFSQQIFGIPLDFWTKSFLVPTPLWLDLVEPFEPL